jgi:hypothetical protein
MTVFFSERPALRPGMALACLFTAFSLAGCDSTVDQPLAPAAATPAVAAATANVTVFATGLRFPRGITFGGGAVYVAEAGLGGTSSTTARECQQATAPVGPYTNGPTARISRIGPDGRRGILAAGFPSAANAMGDVIGVADVAFVGNQLYALVAGGGCSHGNRNIPAGVAEVSSSGDWHIVADLSAYLATHHVKNPPADFEPDGTWYSMLHVGGRLFAVEPNHGEVVRIVPGSGAVSRVVDVSATKGHNVPTALGQRLGNLYLGNLGTFPAAPGQQKIFRLTRTGTLTLAKGGFIMVLGVDFDAKGRLYVLEMTHGAPFPTPGKGRVVRVNLDGSRQVIVDGLFFPTAMRFGPDDRLYISNKGFGPPQPGEILRVDVPDVTPASLAAE